MLKYRQSSGELFFLDETGVWVLWGVGYSGHEEGLNDPKDEGIPNVGPLPHGLWSLSPPYKDDHLGPIAFRLVALTYFGKRSEFRIHGDNSKKNQSASQGCLIFANDIRQKIADNKCSYIVVEA